MTRAKVTLAQDSPNVASQWDYEKNYPLTPDDVTPGSSKKMWWKCDHKHSWESTIKNRTKRNSGCPYCSGRKASNDTNISVTFPEFFEAMKRFGDQKVSPESLKRTSRTAVSLACDKGHIWESSPRELSSIKGDLCPYCSNREVLARFNDLEMTHPDVAVLWDEEANGIPASQVIAKLNHNGDPYHWSCENGHSWQRHMVSAIKHPGCPVCSGREIVFGENDMSVFDPNLYAELDEKHKSKDEMERIFPTSNFKLTWLCPSGHGKYEASMAKRYEGQGCPICAGNRLTVGVNDLNTVRPDIAKQWDTEKNDIAPSQISVGNSTRKSWWICDRDHSYQATVAKRASGTGCPFCANKKVLVGFNDLLTIRPDVAARWHPEKNGDKTPEMFSFRSGFVAWWMCEKGHEWQSDIDHQSGGNSCPRCANIVSNAEQEISDYIASILGDIEVRTSVRNVIYPKELDIYIPEKGVAFEFNGLYWHSESSGKGRFYHYDKWKACKDKGIQLVTIWEDEWTSKREIVKSMISYKLGVSSSKRVFARKTDVIDVNDKSKARDFLDTYHIQGSSSASKYIGLVDDQGDLVAVSAWTKNGNTLYLERFATSCSVVGGMGKLLKKGVALAKDLGCDAIVTFADHQVSDSGLYETLGFREDKELLPDYKYIIGSERKHKFGYRLKRFREDPMLQYVDGMTERELAQLNGIDRVWDCGKTRWVLEV